MKKISKAPFAALFCVGISILQAQPYELQLPDVPAELTVPADRADYILLHFWDGMEFADTVRSLDRNFMSENVAEYLSVFPHAHDSVKIAAVKSFVSATSENAPVAELMSEIIENYLMPKGSPMHDDDLFAFFLTEMIENGYPNEVRNKWLLEMMIKNRPGSKVPDFDLQLRDGSISSFSDIVAGKPAILIFYDPDCGDCAKAISELNDDFLLRTRIESGAVKVVAVYADGDKELWENSSKIPDAWIDGFDTGRIMEQDLFLLPAMPTIYFVMPDLTVGQKDCDVKIALKAAYRFR